MKMMTDRIAVANSLTLPVQSVAQHSSFFILHSSFTKWQNLISFR